MFHLIQFILCSYAQGCMKGPMLYEKLFQRVAEIDIYPRKTTGV